MGSNARGGPEPADFFRAVAADVVRLQSAVGKIDAVFLSGNLGSTGGIQGYSELRRRLSDLWNALQSLGSCPVLLPVPGRDDACGVALAPPELEAGWLGDEEARTQFFSSPNHVFRRALSETFRPYTTWVDDWRSSCQEASAPVWRRGLLPGEFSARLDGGQLRVGVLGLNTVFLDLRGRARRHCAVLEPEQVLSVCAGDVTTWMSGCDVCVLLTSDGVGRIREDSRNRLLGEEVFSSNLCCTFAQVM